MYYTHYYHPPSVIQSDRVHDRTLPERTSNLVDCSFIIIMLYMNAY